MRNLIILPALMLLIAGACNIPAPAAPTQAPVSATRTAAPAARPVPEHRIGVRVNNGIGEFYDRLTGERFVPRGMNYVRLAPQTVPGGGTQVYHSVFDPGQYAPMEAAAQFAKMHADGYNVVRVFLSQNTMGGPSGGLSLAYMQNVADLLKLARQNGLYVLFTQDWLPGGKYGAAINQDCCELFNFNNAQDLPPGAVRAYQLFYTDFITGLLDLHAPTEAIFSYELRNEFYFDSNYPPLSLKSGTVTTANGKTYDMSLQTDKQRMMEENLPFLIDKVRETILKLDPTALVSIGFFVPQEPNRARVGDARLVVSAPAIWESQADFIDLHAYPGFELNLKQHVENFGVEGMQEKPIILGEFGANTGRYPSIDSAARASMDWQIESCKYGFDGWLFWTWDTPGDRDFYTALSGDGRIDRVLAPANRPDPCSQSGAMPFENNLALGKKATASRSLPAEPPSNAVDGTGAQWGAGTDALQWVEIDLGKPSTVTAIKLTVAQYPDGDTTHQIWVRGPDEALHMVFEFNGLTGDNQILEFSPDSPLNEVQFVRILTTRSPSWVAWKEIEIIGQ